jgi:hypothetical protein
MPPPVPISGEESKTQNDAKSMIEIDTSQTTNMM